MLAEKYTGSGHSYEYILHSGGENCIRSITMREARNTQHLIMGPARGAKLFKIFSAQAANILREHIAGTCARRVRRSKSKNVRLSLKQ
jgi:hypothetical protein